MDEAVGLCCTANSLSPGDPKYAYTLGFFQNQTGNSEGAIKTLDALIAGQPAYLDAYLLLAGIYEKQGKKDQAEKVYNKALTVERAPEAFRSHIRAKLEELKEKQ